jgi:chemotaxis protein MotB
MSTMALILFVLVLLAYVHNLISAKRLDAFQRQIAMSEQQLKTLHAEIETGKMQIAASESRLHEQHALVAESNRQLDVLRFQLQSIAVLRVAVLGKVKDAIEAELGARNEAGADLVTIGNNGNIIINESLAFEYNSYAIKNDAKPLLATLARALGHVLSDDAVRENIDTILIQGHTDQRGSIAFNWELSSKRATAVLDYLFDTNKALADSYGSYFAAAAYSKFRPLNTAQNEAAYQQNRRIELSVILKDTNIRKVIDDYEQGANGPEQRTPTGQ